MKMVGDVWVYLKEMESIFSLLAMLFSAYASFRLWRQNRQLRELARTAPKMENFKEKVDFYKGVQTENPVALAISLVPTTPSIKKDVAHFFKVQDWKKDIDIEEINMAGINSVDDVEHFINSLREKRHLFDMQGRTEVHLFMQGPVAAGLLAGAMLDNWKPIKIYHKSTPSSPAIYEYWCPLIK